LPIEWGIPPYTMERMSRGFSHSIYFLWGALLISGCSNLANYSDEVTPNPTTPPVTLPEADHLWAFENNGNDTGSAADWAGSLSGGGSSYSSSSPEVGSYSLALTTNGYFSIGSVTLPSELTIACWVNPTALGSVQTMISDSAVGASNPGLRFYVTATGKLTLETDNGTNSSSLTSASALTTGVYTHIAAVIDSAGSATTIYINGVSNQAGSAISSLNSAAQTTYFGAMTSGTADTLIGNLDDCRIYAEALSAAQISLLYESY
jgi:hypothetical protein